MSKAAISIKERDYVIIEDRGTKDHPSFKLRSLTTLEAAITQDEFAGVMKMDPSKDASEQDQTIEVRMSQMTVFQVATCTKGLIGWANLKDSAGENVPFSVDNITRLHKDHLAELAKEIGGDVSVEDEKNSEPQS